MANEPSENEKEELKFFLYRGDSTIKLGSLDTAQEVHQKAVSIFVPLCEAIRRGDREATLKALGRWPNTVVNYPLDVPRIDSSKASWCVKIARLLKFHEDLTRLVFGNSAGVEISGPDDVNYNIANRAIRDTILRGDIKLASQVLEKFFPSLLHDPRYVSVVPYFLIYQELIELTRQGKLRNALWLANQSLKPMAASHPWLKEEVDKLYELMLSTRRGDPSKISNKELLYDSQRQKTANSVAGATILCLLEEVCCPDHPKGTLIMEWLKGLEYQGSPSVEPSIF